MRKKKQPTTKRIINLWYKPRNDYEITIIIMYPNGQEFSIADIIYDHSYNPKATYDLCVGIAQEMGYELDR